MLTKEKKAQILKEFQKTDKDSGSCEVQVALITERIKQISQHLKSFPKDKHSRRGLITLVARRKTFMKYLKKHDFVREFCRKIQNSTLNSYHAQRQVRWYRNNHDFRIGRWRENLSPEKQEIVEKILKKPLTKLGYQVCVEERSTLG